MGEPTVVYILRLGSSSRDENPPVLGSFLTPSYTPVFGRCQTRVRVETTGMTDKGWDDRTKDVGKDKVKGPCRLTSVPTSAMSSGL